jgi:uncharacterized protein GlcG (DUF336 family)
MHRLPLSLALEAAEGAGVHSIDSATDRAYTAASYKSDTSALVERAAKEPIAPMFDKLPNLLLAGGGVVIEMDKEVLGAIGVSGRPAAVSTKVAPRRGWRRFRGG